MPNFMYLILIIEQNRGNFLGKKLLLYPTADKEAKIEQHAGKKVKKRDAPAPPTAKHNEIIITNIALKIINNKKRYLVIAF